MASRLNLLEDLHKVQPDLLKEQKNINFFSNPVRYINGSNLDEAMNSLIDKRMADLSPKHRDVMINKIANKIEKTEDKESQDQLKADLVTMRRSALKYNIVDKFKSKGNTFSSKQEFWLSSKLENNLVKNISPEYLKNNAVLVADICAKNLHNQIGTNTAKLSNAYQASKLDLQKNSGTRLYNILKIVANSIVNLGRQVRGKPLKGPDLKNLPVEAKSKVFLDKIDAVTNRMKENVPVYSESGVKKPPEPKRVISQQMQEKSIKISKSTKSIIRPESSSSINNSAPLGQKKQSNNGKDR